MQFSIVTPSFGNSEWLKLCIASVADQGMEMEHIVQDSCSRDGTQEWLPRDPRVKPFIEKDKGMYDAINRGLRRSRGEILAHLNCDEQYLPGALQAAWDYFQNNPRVEVAFAHSVVIGPDGDYLCDRRSSVPGKYHSWVSGNLSILTAATFYRRSLIEGRGLYYNAELRDVGDVVWVMSLVENNVTMGILNHFTSAFTETGHNMNLGANAQREKAELLAQAPAWARHGRSLVVAHYRLRRLLAGHYRNGSPYSYAIYTRTSPLARKTFHVPRPTYRWVR